MNAFFEEIIQNARGGTGPCEGCPAQLDTRGSNVNPGLIDPTAELMFLTMDPSHPIDWSNYDVWSEYNVETSRFFIEEWPGGAETTHVAR